MRKVMRMIPSLVVVDDSPVAVLTPEVRTAAVPDVASKNRPEMPQTLEGCVVAVIDSDSPGQSESYFAKALIRELREEFAVAEVVWVKKANRTRPPEASVWQDVIERADAGISMYGGCGTCSSRTMRDAIELQWAGIPSVAISHEDMRGAVESMRRISKADTPYVEVNRPTSASGAWTESETDAVVRRILPSVVAELTSGRAPVRKTA
jgi:hypothetical protein